MGLPETGVGEVSGQWYTVQPGVPDSLTDALDVIQGLVEALLIILNTVLSILQVVKAFLIGFLDPLSAIIDVIIEEIQSLLDDIRNIGIYIAYDEVQPTHENLLGGYQAYERRMIGRLTNRRDPTRPDFSSRTGVIAIFIYVSADTSSIQRLIATIQKILAFFGQRVPTRAYTTPTNLQVTYGTDGLPLSEYGSLAKSLSGGDTPNAANLTWGMAPPPSGTPVKFPWLAPKGFLVEVSTLPDGLLLAFDTVAGNIQPESSAGRVYGLVRDPKTGLPFRLYGGAYMLDVEDLEDPVFESDQDFTTTHTRFYGIKDTASNVPIPIDLLYDVVQDRFYLQRTFFVRGGTLKLTGPGQSFATTLKAEDMPYTCDFEMDGDRVRIVSGSEALADTVFVRVSAVTEEVADRVSTSGPLTSPLNFWTLSSANIVAGAQGLGQVTLNTTYSPDDKTEPSAPLTVTFPSGDTQAYLEALTASLVVLALARCDLPCSYEEDPATQALSSAEALSAYEAEETRLTNLRGQLTEAQDRLSDLTNEGLNPDFDTDTLIDAVAEVEAEIAGISESIALQEAVLREKEAALEEAAAYEDAFPEFLLGKTGLSTGLEQISSYLMFLMLGRNPENYFRKPEQVGTFREDILKRARRTANYLYQQTGPMGDMEAFVVELAEPLLSFKWSDANPNWPDLTLLESLEDSSINSGVALNPMASGSSSVRLTKERMRSLTIDREPGFLVKQDENAMITKVGREDSVFMMGRGSADWSPIVYDDDKQHIAFCRNVFFDADLYGTVGAVLNVAASTALLPAEGGAWRSFRLFPQGLPAVERALNQIIVWAETLKQGISGVVEVILAYIEFLEARILELQNFILRLNGLLDLLLSLDMPSANALIVTGNGTTGIVQALASADNKPSDSSSITSYVDSDGEYKFTGAYGAGIVIVAGGLPSLLGELLQSFFPEES